MFEEQYLKIQDIFFILDGIFKRLNRRDLYTTQ